jgi:hypothetical protein
MTHAVPEISTVFSVDVKLLIDLSLGGLKVEAGEISRSPASPMPCNLFLVC